MSSVIVATLGLQSLAVLRKLPLTFWPFLNYPMYRTARLAGGEILSYVVYARCPRGAEFEISPDDLGINRFKFQGGLVRSIRDQKPDRATLYVDLYVERHGRVLESLRVAARPLVWDEGRIQMRPERTVAVMMLSETRRSS